MQTCPRCNYACQPEDIYCGQCGLRLSIQELGTQFTQKEINVNDIRYNLGVVYTKKGNYQAALDIFEKILKNDPNDQNILRMVAEVKEKIEKQAL